MHKIGGGGGDDGGVCRRAFTEEEGVLTDLYVNLVQTNLLLQALPEVNSRRAPESKKQITTPQKVKINQNFECLIFRSRKLVFIEEMRKSAFVLLGQLKPQLLFSAAFIKSTKVKSRRKKKAKVEDVFYDPRRAFRSF